MACKAASFSESPDKIRLMNTKLFTALAILALTLGGSQFASALLSADADDFAVLGESSRDQTNFNNGTITGDIGIGSPRQLTFSNCSLVGNARFSGTANVSGLSGGPIPGPGPYTVSGGGLSAVASSLMTQS